MKLKILIVGGLVGTVTLHARPIFPNVQQLQQLGIGVVEALLVILVLPALAIFVQCCLSAWALVRLIRGKGVRWSVSKLLAVVLMVGAAFLACAWLFWSYRVDSLYLSLGLRLQGVFSPYLLLFILSVSSWLVPVGIIQSTVRGKRVLIAALALSIALPVSLLACKEIVYRKEQKNFDRTWTKMWN